MKKRILIVEDDVVFCKMLGTFLSKNAYQVEDVQGGVEALNILKKESFDILLVDYKLPDFDGVELIDRIQSIESDKKCILMSRMRRDEISGKIDDITILGFLQKPFSPSLLMELLQKIRD
jgi:DNA-binding response OmpR family regulator